MLVRSTISLVGDVRSAMGMIEIHVAEVYEDPGEAKESTMSHKVILLSIYYR